MKVSVVGASLQGKGHMANGIECQDYFEKYEKNGIYVVALSDGAGSKENSLLGAKAVVKAVNEYIAENFNNLLCKPDSEIEEMILSAGTEALKSQTENISQLACTLLFFATDGEKYICGNIGDGRIFVCDMGCSVLMYGQSGEFANETNFISDKNVRLHFRVCKGYFPDNSLFALVTDGVGNLLYDETKDKVCPALDKIKKWTESYSEDEVLNILKDNLISVLREVTADDLSIVVVYKSRVQC